MFNFFILLLFGASIGVTPPAGNTFAAPVRTSHPSPQNYPSYPTTSFIQYPPDVTVGVASETDYVSRSDGSGFIAQPDITSSSNYVYPNNLRPEIHLVEVENTNPWFVENQYPSTIVHTNGGETFQARDLTDYGTVSIDGQFDYPIGVVPHNVGNTGIRYTGGTALQNLASRVRYVPLGNYAPIQGMGLGRARPVTPPIQPRLQTIPGARVHGMGLGRVLPTKSNEDHDHANQEVIMFALGRVLGRLHKLDNNTNTAPILQRLIELQYNEAGELPPWKRPANLPPWASPPGQPWGPNFPDKPWGPNFPDKPWGPNFPDKPWGSPPDVSWESFLSDQSWGSSPNSIRNPLNPSWEKSNPWWNSLAGINNIHQFTPAHWAQQTPWSTWNQMNMWRNVNDNSVEENTPWWFDFVEPTSASKPKPWWYDFLKSEEESKSEMPIQDI